MYNNNILIIDDDPDLSMITADMLEDNGYNVKTASNTEEGYSILQNEKTNLTYKIKRPLNSIVNNLGSQKPIKFSAYDDILSGIDSYIKLAPNDDAKILGKVINDSELIVSYTKSTNNENQEVYQFTKIKEDEE